jgi:hypothetical protein
MRGQTLLAAALVAASVGGTAAQAAPAKPKPKDWAYDVFLPVPWAPQSMGADDCAAAPEGSSKDLHTFALPGPGKLRVHLSGTVGDWALEFYDVKGHLVSSSHGVGDVVMTVKAKGTKPVYQIGVCNYAGGPNGRVTASFTWS